jgi:hypothetical protein
MIDGLRREFPEVLTLARRIPNPRFARASPMWAVAAAFGAEFFVSAVVTIVFSLLLRSMPREAPFPAPFELARLAGTAAALAVAWIAGGRVAVAGYVGILILERLLGLPNLFRFCSGAGSAQGFAACSVGNYLIALWPQLVGAALAVGLVRWLRAGAGDRNPMLEGAGVFVVVQGLGGALLNAVLGPATSGSLEWPLLLLLVAIAAGVAMGYTILRRATRPWRTFGVIAVVLAGEYAIVSLPSFMNQVILTRGTNLIGPFDLLAYFSPVFAIGAAALVLYMAAARKVSTGDGA